MAQAIDHDHRTAGPSEKEFIDRLRKSFEQMPGEISIFMFVQKGKDDVFADANRQIIRAFRELTPKIAFREFGLDHELARKWQVDSSPTLLIAPERYAIRWLGAPMGEEGRTFLETLMLVGMGQSQLSEPSRKTIAGLDSHRNVKVFVSATCPYCPQQAVNAVKAAIEAPSMVSLEIVDIQCRSDLADQYSAHSVPQAFADDVLIGMGCPAGGGFHTVARQAGTTDRFHSRQRCRAYRNRPVDRRRRAGRVDGRYLCRQKWIEDRCCRTGRFGRSGGHHTDCRKLSWGSIRSAARPW